MLEGMYLVHAELRRADNAPLPPGAARLILDSCRPGEGVEHVTVHADAAGGGPLMGLFVLAGTVEEAERVAADACQRALETHRDFEGFTLLRCAVRLVPDFYDQQFERGDAGRDMPGPN